MTGLPGAAGGGGGGGGGWDRVMVRAAPRTGSHGPRSIPRPEFAPISVIIIIIIVLGKYIYFPLLSFFLFCYFLFLCREIIIRVLIKSTGVSVPITLSFTPVASVAVAAVACQTTPGIEFQ